MTHHPDLTLPDLAATVPYLGPAIGPDLTRVYRGPRWVDPRTRATQPWLPPVARGDVLYMGPVLVHDVPDRAPVELGASTLLAAPRLPRG